MANLTINQEFLEVICMSQDELYLYLLDFLKSHGYENIICDDNHLNGYIFAKGTLPVLLCAHLDKIYSYNDTEGLVLTEIQYRQIVNKENVLKDIELYADRGIGGDDRCGVYAIIDMIRKGHRPSVAFFACEEHGCRGSSNFCATYKDISIMDGINAIIQIDRRGSKDVVNYQDKSLKLVHAVENYDFRFNYGSFTDVRILMDAYGISGVNLSSGYHNEHQCSKEYISIREFNAILKRLNKILSDENIFKERYKVKTSLSHSIRKSFSFNNVETVKEVVTDKFRTTSKAYVTDPNVSFKQLSLFNDIADECFTSEAVCEYCGFVTFKDMLTDVYDTAFSMSVCPDCKAELIKMGYVECEACHSLYDISKHKDFCPLCGNVVNGKEEE